MTTTPASLTLRLLTMAGTAARLGLERVLTLAGIRSEVQLELHVRRFSCRNAKCERRTFAERLPCLFVPSARRTHRLARAQCAVGMAAGAETGARLLKSLAMPTLGRRVKELPWLTVPGGRMKTTFCYPMCQPARLELLDDAE